MTVLLLVIALAFVSYASILLLALRLGWLPVSVEELKDAFQWLNRPVIEIRFTIEMLLCLVVAMAAAFWLAAR